MPRVHSILARAAKRERRCAKCGEDIKVGQAVYKWTRRNWPTAYQHQACGYPRASQLSSRKTAVIYDAIQDADFALSEALPDDAAPGGSYEIDTTPLTDQLSEIADIAESVGAEYEESADNLPEALQYGMQAEALRDVSERLNDWAQELRDLGFDDATIEFRELEEDEDMNEWRDAMQDEIDTLADNLSEQAMDALSEVPEYEG